MKNKNLNRKQGSPISTPTIIPRSEHAVSRADISENALKVLYRLKKAGYAAYLVGGGVRDLLLGLHPKDFDVATDASPEEVKALFRNCRLIGRRFRLAHVFFGGDIVEVATFRAHHADGEGEGVVENGMILRDNVYGTLEDDAWRRDFSVNALYYNIEDFSLVDYTGGMADLDQRVLRIIGDAEVRFKEDPVRMLRAIRFAAKLGFSLEPAMAEQIHRLGHCMEYVPAARLFDEVLKMFLHGHALKTYDLLREHKLFKYLFAETDELLDAFPEYLDAFIRQAMINTDARIHEDKPVSPAFLFAVFLWGPVRKQTELLQEQDMTVLQALQVAGNEVVETSIKQVSLPRRFSLPMREIWQMQARLMMHHGKRPYRLLEHPRFRAAYDFMLLRHEAGEPITELCNWWTEFQAQDESGRQRMSQATSKSRPRRRRRKKTTRPSTEAS